MEKINKLGIEGNLDLSVNNNIENIATKRKIKQQTLVSKNKLTRYIPFENIPIKVFLHNDLVGVNNRRLHIHDEEYDPAKIIKTLGDIMNYTPARLSELGFRTKSIIELKKIFRKYGLSYKESNY